MILKNPKIYSEKTNQLKIIRYDQTYNGVRVYNSKVSLAFRNEKLTFYESNFDPSLYVDTTPKISQTEAISKIRYWSSLDNNVLSSYKKQVDSQKPSFLDTKTIETWVKGDDTKNQFGKREFAEIKSLNPEKTELVIFPSKITGGNDYKLAWKIDMPLDTQKGNKLTYFVDAQTGQIIYKFDNVVYATISGNVQGKIYPENPVEGSEIKPFNHEGVSFEDILSETSNGTYSIDSSFSSGVLASEFSGPFSEVYNYAQPNAVFKQSIPSLPANVDINWESVDTSYKNEESNVFYHFNFIHDYFTRGGAFDIYDLDNIKMTATVEAPGSYCGLSYDYCNACAGGSVMIFLGAGELPGFGYCEATSLGSDIIYHEYTHNVVFKIYEGINFPYYGQTGGMNEGWADYFAASITNDPVMGENIFPSPIRNLENTLRYPENYDPEPHAASEVFSPALWEIRQAVGAEVADALVLNAMKLTPMTFSEFVDSILIVDDDNGNLNDGTPHINDICHAFVDNHGITSSLCVGHTQLPIGMIELPSKTISGPVVEIKGTAYPSSGATLNRYIIEYASIDNYGNVVGDWFSNGITLENNGERVVVNGILGHIDPQKISDGRWRLRLTISDSANKVGTSSFDFVVDNFKITNPLGSDVLRAGDTIKIEGSILLDASSYSIEYSSHSDPNTWSSEGITLSGIALPAENAILAYWNTSSITKGDFYELKISLNMGDSIIMDYVRIYLDPELKQGWPVRIPFGGYTCDPRDPSFCYVYWPGHLEMVSDDLNGDGKKEIVFYEGSNQTVIHVLNPNGTYFNGWPVALPVDLLGGNLKPPTIADLDNDGKKEIIVNGEDKVYIYDLYGNQKRVISLPGWMANWIGNIPAVDLNKDGKSEIIVSYDKWSINAEGYSEFWVELGAFNDQGQLLPGWPKIVCDGRTPNPLYIGSCPTSVTATGNFDSDSDLEIVSVSGRGVFDNPEDENTWHGEGKVLVYNLDGTMVPGFPLNFSGINLGSLAVGDINKDGYDEIVMGSLYGLGPYEPWNGLSVVNRSGKIVWSIFPNMNIWASSSLLDVNKDGYLEIATSVLNGMNTYLLDYNGNVLPGWPQTMAWVSYKSVISGDINGDNVEDIVTTAGCGVYPSPDYHGGVYAWDINGNLFPGYPKVTECDAQASATIEDIDKDGKVELMASSDWDYDVWNDIYKKSGHVYVWDIDKAYNKDLVSWPTNFHDPQHTGLYGYNPSSCTDTDGGNVADVKGTASVTSALGTLTFTDYCQSATILKEYYCENNQAVLTTYSCTDTGCSNGACPRSTTKCYYDKFLQRKVCNKGGPIEA